MSSRTSANLPLQLASAYTLLALYGSLYPFSDWRDSGVAPLAFLTTGWLRYTTAFDLVMNALAYLPFGHRMSAALHRLRGPRVEASWYDPRTGASDSIGTYPADGEQAFQPPTTGPTDDWVLELRSA